MERIAGYLGDCESLGSSHELSVDGGQKENRGLSLRCLTCDVKGMSVFRCSEKRLRSLMTSKATCGHPS